MNFCTGCGGRRHGDMRFCTSCGQAFALSAQAQQDDPAVLANSLEASVRAEATAGIIAAVDIDAMRRAGQLALERGDRELAEFWFMEIATAEADGKVRAEGIELLAREILIPEGRLEEAALYSRHAATHPDVDVRTRAQRTLVDIDHAWHSSGRTQLQYSEEWRGVDVTTPRPQGLSQREHYMRFLAYLFARDGDDVSQRLIAGLQDDYMQNIAGYIIGLSSRSAETGVERETAVKALSDWLDHR